MGRVAGQAVRWSGPIARGESPSTPQLVQAHAMVLPLLLSLRMGPPDGQLLIDMTPGRHSCNLGEQVRRARRKRKQRDTCVWGCKARAS